jgi:predicted secreted protein
MSSNAISGIGTKFYRWSTTSTEWESLAEVKSIKGPGMSRASIEVTSFDSEDGYQEFIGGLRNGGTISLSMNFTRASYALMKADFESDDRQNYKIVLPDTPATQLEFEGLVMELPPSIGIADAITFDVTIQISGKVVLANDSTGLV